MDTYCEHCYTMVPPGKSPKQFIQTHNRSCACNPALKACASCVYSSAYMQFMENGEIYKNWCCVLDPPGVCINRVTFSENTLTITEMVANCPSYAQRDAEQGMFDIKYETDE